MSGMVDNVKLSKVISNIHYDKTFVIYVFRQHEAQPEIDSPKRHNGEYHESAVSPVSAVNIKLIRATSFKSDDAREKYTRRKSISFVSPNNAVGPAPLPNEHDLKIEEVDGPDSGQIRTDKRSGSKSSSRGLIQMQTTKSEANFDDKVPKDALRAIVAPSGTLSIPHKSIKNRRLSLQDQSRVQQNSTTSDDEAQDQFPTVFIKPTASIMSNPDSRPSLEKKGFESNDHVSGQRGDPSLLESNANHGTTDLLDQEKRTSSSMRYQSKLLNESGMVNQTEDDLLKTDIPTVVYHRRMSTASAMSSIAGRPSIENRAPSGLIPEERALRIMRRMSSVSPISQASSSHTESNGFTASMDITTTELPSGRDSISGAHPKRGKHY